jgi:hypothetical protein
MGMTVNYTIEMLHQPKKPLPEESIRLNMNDTYSVPWMRRGVQTADNPEKTGDETAMTPLVRLHIPAHVLEAGAGLVQKELFTPEYLANLQGVIFEGSVMQVEANGVNYGAVPTMRELTRLFSEEVMLPVLKQIAPISVRATLISSENGTLYLGRRANVSINGKLDTYPAGTVTYGHGLGSALRKEAREEAGIEIGIDGTATFVGIARGRTDSPNPNFNYIIETPWSVEKMRESLGPEHDKVYAIALDEEVLTERIVGDFVRDTPDHDRMTDAGLAALLQACRAYFGDKWYADTKGEIGAMADPRITILERDIVGNTPRAPTSFA